MNPKVLFVSTQYPPDLGGGPVVAKTIVESLNKYNFNTILLTSCRKENLYSQSYYYAHIKYLWPFLLAYRIRASLKKHCDIDLIILNDTGSSFAMGLLTKKHRAKAIPIIHGLEAEKIYLPATVKSNAIRLFHKRTIVGSRAILAVGEFINNKFINLNLGPYIAEKMRWQYIGVDVDRFSSLSAKSGRISSNGITLVTASRLIWEKGFRSKIGIFTELIDRGESFRWIIVGDGPNRQEIEDSLRQYEDHVEFVGAKDHQSLTRIYSDADIFWLLSDYDEALPLSYLEAQACGLPCIGRCRGGVKETISSKTGYLVSSDDECLRILSNWTETFRDFCGESIRSSVKEKFDKNLNMDGLSKWLRTLM